MDSSELPKRAKLAHVLSVVVAGVIALAVSAVLADGTSVIRLKHAKYLRRRDQLRPQEGGPRLPP